jgi:hypothetical protein
MNMVCSTRLPPKPQSLIALRRVRTPLHHLVKETRKLVDKISTLHAITSVTAFGPLQNPILLHFSVREDQRFDRRAARDFFKIKPEP